MCKCVLRDIRKPADRRTRYIVVVVCASKLEAGCFDKNHPPKSGAVEGALTFVSRTDSRSRRRQLVSRSRIVRVVHDECVLWGVCQNWK